MDNIKKQKLFLSKVKELMNDGMGESQAIALVCKKLSLNPYIMKQRYFNSTKSENDTKNDVKTKEGSFVKLKKDDGNKYEVININSKNNIILRNCSNNQEISKSDNEIEPIFMENVMKKKMNEAQYTVTMNGLETSDANALSQIFALANQADQNGGESMDSVDPMMVASQDNDIEDFGDTVAPTSETGMDVAMPSEDMNGVEIEPAGDIDSDIDMSGLDDFKVPSIGDETEIASDVDDTDDIAFDDEIGSEDIDMADESELTTDDADQDLFNDYGDMGEFDSMSETFGELDEDILLDKSQEDPTVVAKEKTEMDEEDDGLDSDIQFETMMKNAGIKLDEEVEDEIEDDVEDEDTEEIEEDELFDKEPISDDNGEYEILRDKERGYWYIWNTTTDEQVTDEDGEPFRYDSYEEAKASIEPEDVESDELVPGDELEETDPGFTIDDTEVDFSNKEPVVEDDFENESEDVMEHFRIMMKNAGIKLDEEQTPEVITDESLAINKDGEEETAQHPKYKTVKTAHTFGKDSSEGAKTPSTIKVETKTSADRIKSICETASHMYAKKESKDWLALDRRYVEKLIKEGVNYSTASKLLMKAKIKK